MDQASAQFNPVNFPPNTGIADFAFPAPAATIDQWVANDDIASIAAHAWGLWVGINMDSGQVFQGQNLRVFHTWNTKGELSIDTGPSAAAQPRSLTPAPLRQFSFLRGRKVDAAAIPAGSPLGFVKFDPTAVDHITKNKLRSPQTLDSLVVAGKISNVPDFPNTAISLKVETSSVREDRDNPGFARLDVWPGPPPNPIGFGPDKWNTFVWIDLNANNANTGDGSVGRGTDVRKPANTYSINNFINFKDGDGLIRIVTAMHITTREIVRWTWQTFWWTPDPAKPPLPSSSQIANARPQQLLAMGAPAHYAVSLGYSMRTARDNTVFVYSPYLEASFEGLAGNFSFGVQSNCMSCHANAVYPGIGIENAYVGNENVDITGSQFHSQVRLDFLYSISPNPP
jgi:hypothetical protein